MSCAFRNSTPSLHRPRPLGRSGDVAEAVALHVADGLRPGAVGDDRPCPRLRDGVEEIRRAVDLAADLIGLVVDEQRPARHEAAHQHRRVAGEAPIGAEQEAGIGRRLERLHLPVLEHPGLAEGLVAAEPDMLVLVRVARPVPLHLHPQHLREMRVVGIFHRRQQRSRAAASRRGTARPPGRPPGSGSTRTTAPTPACGWSGAAGPGCGSTGPALPRPRRCHSPRAI